MKTVFMGTPDFAAASLSALLEGGYEVAAVFTQPDKPVGRKAVLTPSPVKQLALLHNIPVYQPARIRAEENLAVLRDLAPDVIVVAAYGQIIPKAILQLPAYGCINVHASLLPAWRGAAPIQWSIMAGDSQTGVTIMQMGEGLDTGDMLSSVTVPISAGETGGSLFDALAAASGPLLVSTLKRMEEGSLTPVRQPESSTTPYAAMLTRESGCIDWSKGAAEIERQIRALDPWPGTYTWMNGKKLKIWQGRVCSAAEGLEAGTLYGADEGRLIVSCGSGALEILSLQPEGKKRMDSSAYLRGYHAAPGTVLGLS